MDIGINNTIAWARASSIIPLAIWLVIMIRAAWSTRSFYRACAAWVLLALLIVAFEIWRRRTGVGPHSPLNGWLNLVVQLNLVAATWVAMIAAAWPFICAWWAVVRRRVCIGWSAAWQRLRG